VFRHWSHRAKASQPSTSSFPAFLLLIASGVLLFTVFRTEEILEIARALSVYAVVVAILLGSAAFQKRR
jgi:hypothetical protein